MVKQSETAIERIPQLAEPKVASIQGLEFTVSQPFEVGHVCTEAEARALNQTRKENIVNSFRPKVKAYVEAEDDTKLDELNSSFLELDASYEFTIANVGATQKLTPVEREARTLAKNYIKGKLAEKGRKLTDVPTGSTEQEWDDKLEGEIARISALPEIVKVAEKNVKERNKLGDMQLEVLGLGTGEATAETIKE